MIDVYDICMIDADDYLEEMEEAQLKTCATPTVSKKRKYSLFGLMSLIMLNFLDHFYLTSDTCYNL